MAEVKTQYKMVGECTHNLEQSIGQMQVSITCTEVLKFLDQNKAKRQYYMSKKERSAQGKEYKELLRRYEIVITGLENSQESQATMKSY